MLLTCTLATGASAMLTAVPTWNEPRSSQLPYVSPGAAAGTVNESLKAPALAVKLKGKPVRLLLLASATLHTFNSP